MDKITIERIQLLHPKLRQEAALIYAEICGRLTNCICRFAFTLRTFAEQDKLYQQGRTTPGQIVTNARKGLSYHNYGMAIDIVLIKDGKPLWDTKVDFDKDGKSDWLEIVQIFKEHGWEWGGDWGFKDYPHFQKTLGYSVRQLLTLHEQGRVDKNGFVLI